MLLNNPKHSRKVTKLTLMALEKPRVKGKASRGKFTVDTTDHRAVVESVVYSSHSNEERTQNLQNLAQDTSFNSALTNRLFSLANNLKELSVTNTFINTISCLRGLFIRNSPAWHVENETLGRLRDTFRVIEVRQYEELPRRLPSPAHLDNLRTAPYVSDIWKFAQLPDLEVIQVLMNVMPAGILEAAEDLYLDHIPKSGTQKTRGCPCTIELFALRNAPLSRYALQDVSEHKSVGLIFLRRALDVEVT
ncbi:hypothetical protein CC86DRAFT_385046 [Ophiobolus disseminans]|uniref:Uncharacterized protein n=1 Tax=Ophiobolus disseminans TaxID=1469910 RepID=A0A6A6ZP31_9PLEO|nr:hypothetical protein CC86DRAFT_385046 [Ophiobolus disseminans]